MAIQKFEDDLNIISKLGDNPGTDNGLTTPQFRAMFDKAGLMIQKFINDVILPAMNASNNPQEGLSMQGGINMNGQVLNGIKAPGAADDAANKQYVDESAKELKQYVDDGFHKSDWLPTAQEIGAVPAVESDDHPGCFYRTVDGVTEWLNPPMEVGVEYRTTERSNDQPRYVKKFEFGNLPNSTAKALAHGIPNATSNIVRIDALAWKINGDVMPFPLYLTGVLAAYCYVDNTNIYVKSAKDASGYSATFTIYYIKQ